MTTVAWATLGCKVNQCESAHLEERLRQAGMRVVPFGREADIYCINTCAVTSRAAMQSRQLLRRAARINPAARVVAMGCYAQVGAEDIRRIPGVTHILGSEAKLRLLDHLRVAADPNEPHVDLTRPSVSEPCPPLFHRGFRGRTRAFVKVQDGCDARCSYCIVPDARGPSRSVAPEAVLAQVEGLLAAGFQEIVLTGIHLGRWGWDLQPAVDLAFLLRRLIDNAAPPRLRLSSLEPAETTDAIIRLLAETANLCPHLHVPLQSGDPAILQRMNRHYTPDYYRQRLMEAVAAVPGLAVGVDVLVGFPGESAEAFLNTYRLLEELPVAYLHVFPFSPRPGTPAAAMAQQVDPAEIRCRCRRLRELDQEKRRAFATKFMGTVRPVLLEDKGRGNGYASGLTDNYLRVLIPSPGRATGIVAARLERYENGKVIGRIVSERV